MENTKVTYGLKCDNPTCDWRDDKVTPNDYEQWLNKPCPDCGENLLTETDYENAKQLLAMIDLLSSIPKEKFEEFYKTMGLPNEMVKITFDTHESISIDKVERLG